MMTERPASLSTNNGVAGVVRVTDSAKTIAIVCRLQATTGTSLPSSLLLIPGCGCEKVSEVGGLVMLVSDAATGGEFESVSGIVGFRLHNLRASLVLAWQTRLWML
ncbi:putative endo-beta-1,4-glucanase D [Fusarium oxysporum f. sp. albedinis]|nr:putative endo-beta-1,4-glucanase D [Fusarium oxysporum f. sp. albedinis]